MRALLVARKSLRELLREPQLLLLVVLIPQLFVLITAFGYSGPLLATYPVLYGPGLGNTPLLAALADERYADGRPVLALSPATDERSVEAALQDQSATAFITMGAGGTGLTIRGDAVAMRFYRASVLLEDIVARQADRAVGRPQVIQLVERTPGGLGPQSEFDSYAPGMIVFALLLGVPQTTMLVAREVRWGTLRRLRLTRLGAADFYAGISLAQLAVAGVQVPAVFAVALAAGFHNQGSLLLALVVGLAIAFSAIGQGLLVACFVENDSQAINLGSVVAMVQVLFSGAFYRLPPMTVGMLAGHPIDLFDVFPATHGFLALQQVLSYGAGLPEIAFRLAATLVLSLLYLGLGIGVFRRLKGA